ncbi:MAG: class I SAM-dependent methyltransferase, partial [Acidobacteriota bacterium]
MKDPGPRIGFLSSGVTPDYGRRLSRLRWRRRFPGATYEEIAPDAEATRALSASEKWVLVRDETALPATGPSPHGEAGRILLAARLSPSAAPFVHTLRELEVTPRPQGAEPLSAAQSPAISFSVADFSPREGETVAGYVLRLVSSPTPNGYAPGFAAVCFDEGPGGERPEVIRLLPAAAASLLDVGCASGEAGAAFRRASPEVVVTGIERERGAAERARSRLDRVIEGEAVAALAELVRAGERFDAFLFADVLEHLEDPIGALVLAHELASPDASLVASVPNVGHLS